ncbi:uncharacterized protein N7443_000091 [Penicillium atrosanguineum]|uniref:uncharacterized protein n=1 Tax=Penicillium atrosanguineum TaxID=1132637 RepID=UPI002390464C|nr:uncharacterized protein N7443_000091 [Penicillium atrosanguineum]KAJ5313207.1 hypothetical protein N7443_000091 [Penicillium atrosanguineum]
MFRDDPLAYNMQNWVRWGGGENLAPHEPSGLRLVETPSKEDFGSCGLILLWDCSVSWSQMCETHLIYGIPNEKWHQYGDPLRPKIWDLEVQEKNKVEDPSDPETWPSRKKIFVVFVGLLTLFNSVFDSTIPSGGIEFIPRALNVKSETQQVLPTSVYLIGYVTGPLAFGPLSELYGGRPVMVGTFVLFTIFTLAYAVAPDWLALIIFRVICGICASSPIAITGGLFADVYRSPPARGRTMALSMAVTTAGPHFAPLVAGFIAPVVWRWIF